MSQVLSFFNLKYVYLLCAMQPSIRDHTPGLHSIIPKILHGTATCLGMQSIFDFKTLNF